MLIGSKALKHWFPDLPREPADEDRMLVGEKIVGIDSHACPAFDEIVARYDTPIAPPNLLYTIKVSHSFWGDIHWDKTMYDIAFMQRKGCQIDEWAFRLLYAQWEKVHGPKPAYLATDNDAFFDDGVKRIYRHDDVHRAVAFYDAPLFERLKPDLSSARCSKALFMALSPLDRLRCVQEEAFVIALERFLIPNDLEGFPFAAYRKALKLMITSLSKGWWPRYIVENWLDISSKPDYDFRQRFKSALNRNQLQSI